MGAIDMGISEDMHEVARNKICVHQETMLNAVTISIHFGGQPAMTLEN